MPNRKQFKTDEEYRKWYRDYRVKNLDKQKEYHLNYMRKWRKKQAIKNRPDGRIKK